MKEYTNKLAFNYQTLQEVPKHRAAGECISEGPVASEIFQGWA